MTKSHQVLSKCYYPALNFHESDVIIMAEVCSGDDLDSSPVLYITIEVVYDVMFPWLAMLVVFILM